MNACSTTPDGAIFKSWDFKGILSELSAGFDDPVGMLRSKPCLSKALSGTTLEDAPKTERLALGGNMDAQ
jgi:hypothetical protein